MHNFETRMVSCGKFGAPGIMRTNVAGVTGDEEGEKKILADQTSVLIGEIRNAPDTENISPCSFLLFPVPVV